MSHVDTETVEASPGSNDTPTVSPDELVEDSLVEEVSIDGMCGVY